MPPKLVRFADPEAGDWELPTFLGAGCRSGEGCFEIHGNNIYTRPQLKPKC